MTKSRETILAEIDSTLDQLIENAKILGSTKKTTIYNNEVEALQKMQESLLAHLIHMDQILEINSKKRSTESNQKWNSFQKKFEEFNKLNAIFINNVANRFKIRTAHKPVFKGTLARRPQKNSTPTPV